MSNTHIILVTVFLAVAIAAFTGHTASALLFAFLGTVFLLPNAITTFGYDRQHVGIAPGYMTIYSYSIVLLLAITYLIIKNETILTPSTTAMGGFLLAGLLLWWGNTPYQRSGVLLLLTAIAAVVFGRYTGRRITTLTTFQLFFTWVLVILILVETVVCVAQSLGIQMPGISQFAVSETTADTTAGRVYGTTDHPGTLGKLCFIALALFLPSLNQRNKMIRLPAIAGISAALTCLILSEGRANFYAAIVLIALWAVVSPSIQHRSRSRIGLITIAASAFIASYGIFLNRFQEADKNNLELNPRTHLMGIALRNLPNWIVPGTGPNSYVDVIGKTDALTAQGWPVHNSAMLLLMELGIIGFALATFAAIRLLSGAIQCRRAGEPFKSHSTALLCAIPGFIIIGWTGWGLNGGVSLMLFAFYLGVVRGATDHRSKSIPVSRPYGTSTIRTVVGESSV